MFSFQDQLISIAKNKTNSTIGQVRLLLLTIS